MKVNLTIAMLALSIQNEKNETVLDYSIENVKVDGDIIALMKLGEEISNEISAQMDASGFDVAAAIEAAGQSTKQ